MADGRIPFDDATRRLETSASDAAAIATVRRAVVAHLERCGAHNIPDAVLVLSELVTNAVLHGGGAERVVVTCGPDWIRLDVHDRVADVPRPRQDRPEIGGHGLHIVERLSDRWGATPSGDGKDVWAILGADAAALPR